MTTTIRVYADFYDLDDNKTGRELEHQSDVEQWDEVFDEISMLRDRYRLTDKTPYQWRSELVFEDGQCFRMVLEVDHGIGLIPVGIFGSIKAG